MATNKLLPFANGTGANVSTFAEWQALTKYLQGFTAGIANSKELNRVFAQGAAASYVLGQLIVDQSNVDADIDASDLYSKFKTALLSFVQSGVLPSPSGKKHQVLRVNNAGDGVEWYDLLPVGSMLMFGKDQSHTGFLKCDGSTFSSTDYPELYAYLGTNVLPNLAVSKKIDGTIHVFGNGYSLAITDGIGYQSFATDQATSIGHKTEGYGQLVPNLNGSGTSMSAQHSIGAITKGQAGAHPEYSGLVADLSGVGSLRVYIKY